MYSAILWCTQSHCASQHSPTFSKLTEEKAIEGKSVKNQNAGSVFKLGVFDKVLMSCALLKNFVYQWFKSCFVLLELYYFSCKKACLRMLYNNFLSTDPKP